MRRISLTNLETLCWIARLGTFTAAAQRLHTTQPTISARIHELEQSLGVPLFQGKGRKRELTIQGRELVQRAEPVLHTIEDIALSLDNLETANGIVTIGVAQIVAMSWFAGFLAGLKRLMPKVIYEIDLDLNMRQRLELGKLDLAIGAAPMDSPSVVTMPLGAVEMIWVASPQLISPGQSATEVLARYPLWSLSKPALLYEMTMETLRRNDVRERNLNTCDHVLFLIETVVKGGGVAMLPGCLIEAHLNAGSLVHASAELLPEQLHFVIARNKDQDQVLVQKIMKMACEASTFPKVMPTHPGGVPQLRAVTRQGGRATR